MINELTDIEKLDPLKVLKQKCKHLENQLIQSQNNNKKLYQINKMYAEISAGLYFAFAQKETKDFIKLKQHIDEFEKLLTS